MKKLVSLLVAFAFALSGGFAVAASHVGAKPMEKNEMTKSGDKKAKKAKKAKKTKKEAKKDDMKK
jgi:hypothetical protein